MKYELLPIVWNSDVTEQVRRCQFSICVSLNGTDVQQGIFLSGTHATLEHDLVASSRDVINPIKVREF